MPERLAEAIARMRPDGEKSLSAKATQGRYRAEPNIYSTGYYVTIPNENRTLAEVYQRLAGLERHEAAANAEFFAAARDDAPLIAEAADLLLRIVRKLYGYGGGPLTDIAEGSAAMDEFNARFPGVLEEGE